MNPLRNGFISNVLIVISGTLGAQIITTAITPIITRLYGPEEFGMLGMFMAVLTILGPITALTYPNAIVLPKSDIKAFSIAKLSLVISITFSLLVLIMVYIFFEEINNKLSVNGAAYIWYLLPAGMFSFTLYHISEQWLIRKKEYKTLSKVAVTQSSFLNATKVLFGYLSPTGVYLIIITTLGYCLHSYLLHFMSKKKITKYSVKESELQLVAKEYADFPKYRSPQVFLNLASQGAPLIFLGVYFGAAAAGFYTLARSIMGVPATLIGKAVGDVFYPKISEAAENKQNIFKYVLRSTIWLAIVGFFPYVIVILYGEYIFGLIFGSEWIVAGSYASWLSYWIYSIHITAVYTNTLAVINEQKFNLFFTIFKVSSRLLSIFLCVSFNLSAINTVMVFSIVSTLINIVFIILVLNLVKKYDFKK
jgi:O-antigen/teichoic acid export membrane protein